MAAQFQVNITISAGADFTQEYTVTTPDNFPVNITGYKFYANLAKHPTAINAAVSTSGNKLYSYTPFITRVVNGVAGVYSITLPASETSKLPEGKYQYNVIMENLDGEKINVIGGVAFVDVAFGAVVSYDNGGAGGGSSNNISPPSSQYVLTPATRNSLGGVIVGGGLNVTSGGVISVALEAQPYRLPAATRASLGGVIVGSGLSVTGEGILSADPVTPPTSQTLQTLQVNGTSTLHTIVTGSQNGVAINASAGEITAQWINTGINPTTDTADNNYNVSIRAAGKVVAPEVDVATLSGARQGMIYKLSLGDGLTFRDHASSHIGGTVGATAASGNQYSTNSGTIDLDGVMRTTGNQTLVGDLMVTDGVAGRNGTVKTTGLILTSPNGTEYKVTVADDGSLVTTAI